MSFDEVTLEVGEGIATIRLNNPKKLNALAAEHYRAMREMVARIRNDFSIRALCITGVGKAFCVGADLTFLAQASQGEHGTGVAVGDLMRDVCNPLVNEIQSLPFPVLTILNGPAAGAGVGIALSADVVIAARSAYFYLPFAPKLGILPDLGATWFLPRLAGRGRSLALALLGDRLPAQQAADWGVVWSCVDDDALTAEARLLAIKLADLPCGVALELRRAWQQSGQNSLAAQLEYERVRQIELLDSQAFQEGLAAFKEKRAPSFHVDAR